MARSILEQNFQSISLERNQAFLVWRFVKGNKWHSLFESKGKNEEFSVQSTPRASAEYYEERLLRLWDEGYREIGQGLCLRNVSVHRCRLKWGQKNIIKRFNLKKFNHHFLRPSTRSSKLSFYLTVSCWPPFPPPTLSSICSNKASTSLSSMSSSSSSKASYIISPIFSYCSIFMLKSSITYWMLFMLIPALALPNKVPILDITSTMVWVEETWASWTLTPLILASRPSYFWMNFLFLNIFWASIFCELFDSLFLTIFSSSFSALLLSDLILNLSQLNSLSILSMDLFISLLSYLGVLGSGLDFLLPMFVFIVDFIQLK